MAIIKIRRGTLAQWVDANPVLADGELGFVIDAAKPFESLKIGDGSTLWSSLPYIIEPGSIGADEIADDAINSNHISDAAVGTSELAADAIDGTKIADDSIGSEHIQSLAVGTSELAADAVDGTKIADDAIGTEHIQSLAVGTAELAADAVDDTKIADNAVGSEHIQNLAVGTSELAADAVDDTKIADNAIGSEHIQNLAVGTSELAADAVDDTKIADNAIGTEHIQASAVTANELLEVYPDATGQAEGYVAETDGVNGWRFVTTESVDNQTAAQVPFTPAGNVASTDVQNAIEELDTEKSDTSHNHDGAYDPAGTTASHESDSTNIHGIADTSALLDSSDIGSSVQAWSAVLDGTTASFTTADETKLDGIESSATADQTPSEILADLVTVDGDGSGLDADLLDGLEAAAFALSSHGEHVVPGGVDVADLASGVVDRLLATPNGNPDDYVMKTSGGEWVIGAAPGGGGGAPDAPDGSTYVYLVNHGATPATARPSAPNGENFIWKGTVEPDNAVGDDIVLVEDGISGVFRKDSDENKATDTTPAFDSELKFTAYANKSYKVTVQVSAVGGSTGKIQLGFDGPAGSTADVFTEFADEAATTHTNTTTRRRLDMGNTLNSGVVASTPGLGATLEVFFTCGGTTGTAGLVWAQAASDATNTTVESGSWMSVEEVTLR